MKKPSTRKEWRDGVIRYRAWCESTYSDHSTKPYNEAARLAAEEYFREIGATIDSYQYASRRRYTSLLVIWAYYSDESKFPREHRKRNVSSWIKSNLKAVR